MSKEYIAKTLKRLRESVGLTADQVGEIIGKSGKTVNAWENGRGQPDAEILIKLCGVYKVDNLLAEFDTTNTISKIKNFSAEEISIIKKYRDLDPRGRDVVNTVLEKEYAYRTEKEKQGKTPLRFSIRLAEVGASAGVGNWIDDCRFEDIEIEETPEAHLADFAVKVDGDSMQPDYDDGDIVLVVSQPSIYQGQIGIFCVDGSTYIKELGENELISENPKFDNIPIYEYTDIRCIGRVICKAVVL